MSFGRLAVGVFMALLLIYTLPDFSSAAEPRRIRLGYFEGGKYPYHDRLKEEFLKQLNAVLPDSLEAVFASEGYRSAEWDRAASTRMAKELVEVTKIELTVAFGPWVVPDLLSAGYKKPIVAMHQFAPQYEGLLDKSGKPLAANLTIHVQRDKLEKDLARLAGLIKLRKLGFLYFPSSIEADSVLAKVKTIGAQVGFEVVSAEGANAKGTYAFFNAYGKLDQQIDALYIPPLWGLDIQMIKQFFYNTDHDRIPVMTSEDKFLVDRGALLTNNAGGIFSEARFGAYKCAQIILGKRPSDLPVEFSSGTALALNEATAQKCKIPLERRIYQEAALVAAPVSEDSPTLSLAEAISRSSTFNPGYLARHEAVEAAAQAAAQAYAAYLPQLNLSASLGYRDDNYVNNSRNELKNEFYAARLNLDQTIFSLETIRTIQVAAKNRDLQKFSLAQSQLDLENAVTGAFLNYLKAREILDIQSRIRELIDRNIEISGAKFLMENGAEYELSRWRSERDEATQAISAAHSNLKVARILLNVLLNYPAEQNIILRDEPFSASGAASYYGRIFDKLSQPATLERLAGQIFEIAAGQNAQVRQSEQKLLIQKALLSQNKSRFFPTLNFRATLSRADELQDTPPPFKEEKDSWTLSGIINFPLFEGTDRIRERRRLKAELSRLEYELDGEKLAADANVRAVFQKMLSHFDNLPVANRRLGQSRINLEQVVEQYDAGELDIINLLDELNEITDAQIDELLTRFGFFEAMADVISEMGWSASETGTSATDKMEQLINQN